LWMQLHYPQLQFRSLRNCVVFLGGKARGNTKKAHNKANLGYSYMLFPV
jgi:hypothetical protein